MVWDDRLGRHKCGLGEPPYVTESKNAAALLGEVRDERIEMAIVVDETFTYENAEFRVDPVNSARISGV